MKGKDPKPVMLSLRLSKKTRFELGWLALVKEKTLTAVLEELIREAYRTTMDPDHQK